jgi:hypothetical protein
MPTLLKADVETPLPTPKFTKASGLSGGRVEGYKGERKRMKNFRTSLAKKAEKAEGL